MGRSARPTIHLAAWLLAGAVPAACVAQAPVRTSPGTPGPSPRGVRSAAPDSIASRTPDDRALSNRQDVSELPPALTTPLRPPQAPEGDAAATRPDPLATGLTLEAAPLAPNDLRFPINLATALRLSDARPLVVAAAQAGVWVAEAELTRAKVLWVPALNLGFNYIRHDGGGPDFNKGIMTAPSTNFFYAGGGLWGIPLGSINLTDAYYEPLVARRSLDARHWDVQAAKNDAMLRTADAYFRVHQARGTYAGALYCVGRGRDLAARVERLGADLVPAVELDRARNMLADLEQRATSARERWRVASADLTQVLRLDPRAVVEPLEHDHAQVTLIDPGREHDDLMGVALRNRPELASRRAELSAAEVAIRRERARPFVPSILLNGFQTPFEMIQGGIFGLGPNSSLNQWRGRFDFSIQPLWQLESVGIGNLARIKQQRGMESRAMIELFDAQDTVAADVTRALANLQSAAARVYQADRALRSGIVTFNGTFEGLQQTRRFGDVLTLINRPQEAVYALQLLYVAFEEYFGTVGDYNRSQFELFHALGYPASELTWVRTPGPLIPVDTTRPSYLPPVGNGPPPATR